MERTIKTTLTKYYYNLDKPEERKVYKKLCDELKKDRTLFDSISHNSSKFHESLPDGKTELETNCIFDNQWNTVSGFRVFDWSENIYFQNRRIKEGHYLNITEEMVEIRNNTFTCRYCGKMYYKPNFVFCDACFGNEFLDQDELHLLRLKPVSDKSDNRKLTEDEKNELIPKYTEAQVHGNTKRDKKRLREEREKIEREYTETTQTAKEEKEGLLWLMDHAVHLGNVIYYNHTRRFCFGWKKPVANTVRSYLLDVLCEFPFDYDIK